MLQIQVGGKRGLPPQTHQAIRHAAISTGKTLGQLIEEAWALWTEKHGTEQSHA